MAKRFPELSSSEHVSVSEVIDMAKQRAESKKLKLYENIIASSDDAKRNWKLMYLDTNNISATQIQLIDEKIQKKPSIPNKMKMLKIFRRENIKNFNADSFFITLKAIDRN